MVNKKSELPTEPPKRKKKKSMLLYSCCQRCAPFPDTEEGHFA